MERRLRWWDDEFWFDRGLEIPDRKQHNFGLTHQSRYVVMAVSTQSMFGLRVMNQVTREDYIEWATGMLANDFDTPSLRMLAGLESDSNGVEAGQHFDTALRELGIREPDRDSAFKIHAREIAQQILDGAILSEDGVRKLYNVWIASEYMPEFRVWDWLDDEIALGKAATSLIRSEARDFIDQMKAALPNKEIPSTEPSG